ncbi:MAG: hypothetical protein K2J86_03960 [Prevotella sp.]|nr:hypothetical protein [Prevotella sp.]MDE6011440.1 hypothetical protein [Prevotella sp.]MDE6689026.1 hypothetical protein [Prevotella sp.]
MSKNVVWQDDYWLLLLQLYLRKPVGVKPLYSRDMVSLSLELHIAPQALQSRMQQIARLETPRIERIWNTYSGNSRRLARAVALLREMKGFGAADNFYDGVEIQETFEKDFRPLAEDDRFSPVMLILILNLYFQLTPITMVSETPEVQELARLLKTKATDVAFILDIFQRFDPYLKREEVIVTPLLLPCQQVWQRFAHMEPNALDAYAKELRVFFES